MRKFFFAKQAKQTKRRLSISPVTAVLFLLFMLYDRSVLIFITFLTAGIHESGHLLMMKWQHVELESVTLHFFGADIRKRRKELSYTADLAVSLGGILANLTALALLLPFSYDPVIKLFVFCNFTLASMNALPIRPLDGGEALASLLLFLLPRHYALRISHAVSFLFLVLLWCAAVYILMFSGGNPSLFFISVYLFGSFFLSESDI